MGEPPRAVVDGFDFGTSTPDVAVLDPTVVLGKLQDMQVTGRDMIRNRRVSEKLREAAKEPAATANPLSVIYGTQVGVSLLSAGLLAGVLYAVNPPITQLKRNDDYTSENQDWKKVLTVCLGLFLLAFLGPDVLRFLRKPKTAP